MGQRYNSNGNGNGNINNGNRSNSRQGGNGNGGGDNGGGNGGGKSPPTHDLVLVAKDQEGKYAIVKEFNQQAGMDTSVRLGALWITDLDGNPLKDIKIFGRIGPENGEREAVRGLEIRPRDGGNGGGQGSNGGNSGGNGGNSGGNRGGNGNGNGGGQGGAPAQQSRGNYGGGNRNSGNGRGQPAHQQAPRQQQQSGSRFDD